MFEIASVTLKFSVYARQFKNLMPRVGERRDRQTERIFAIYTMIDSTEEAGRKYKSWG